MITAKQEARIVLLLQGGHYSRHEIAIRCDVCRGTVTAVANGTLHAARRNSARRQAAIDGDFIRPNGPLVRCPECGGMVQMPCLSCYLECGEKYPASIMALYNHPAVQLSSRKCIKCGKTKTLDDFRGDVSGADGMDMHFHTCATCRSNEISTLGLRRKCHKDNDRRVTGESGEQP